MQLYTYTYAKLCLSSLLANLEPDFRITLGCHSGYVSTLNPVLLLICRIGEAAPILTDGSSTHIIKFRSGTPQTPRGNKNGLVSKDELHHRSKKTLQGLLPQVNAPTSKSLLKPRSVPNSPLHFLLIFSADRIRHWDAGCYSPAKRRHIIALKINGVFEAFRHGYLSWAR
jgi:hypothetical protein